MMDSAILLPKLIILSEGVGKKTKDIALKEPIESWSIGLLSECRHHGWSLADAQNYYLTTSWPTENETVQEERWKIDRLCLHRTTCDISSGIVDDCHQIGTPGHLAVQGNLSRLQEECPWFWKTWTRCGILGLFPYWVAPRSVMDVYC